MPPSVEYWDDTVTPFLFWISKGDLTRMTYAEFHGLLIARYILNEFKWIFAIFGRWWRWLYSPILSLNQSTAVSYFSVISFRITVKFEMVTWNYNWRL